MAFSDAVLALSPAAFYRLGEASGTTMTDASGNGRNGTYIGSPTLGVPGLVGDTDTAVSFDGVNDGATVPDAPWLDFTSAFSLVVPFKPGASADWRDLVTRSSMLEMSITDTGSAYIYLSTSAGSFEVNAGTVAADAVQMMTATYDGATLRLYLDDSLVGSTAATGTMTPGSTPLVLGQFEGGPNPYLGVLDDVAVFTTALSATNVADLWAALLAGGSGGGGGPAPVGTDLTYGNYGYGYTGETLLEWSPPAATPPLGAFPAAASPQRVHHVLPALTFDNGRPVFAGFGSEVIEPWVDYLRVSIGGRDMTWLRDAQTVIHGWQNLDPYGDASLTLTLPAVTEFDTFGTGDLASVYKTARVTLNRVGGGVVVDAQDPLFDGIVARLPLDSGTAQVTCEGNFMGRQSRLLHQPYLVHNPARDPFDHIDRELTKIYRSDFRLVGSPAGFKIRSRGDRSMTRLGFYDHILGLSGKQDGTNYTLLPDRSIGRNVIRFQARTMTTVDATVYAGAHGVKVGDFAEDIAENRIYAEWQTPSGGRRRNAVFPNAGYDDDAPDFPGDLNLGDSGVGVELLNRRLWGLGLLDSDDAPGDLFDDDTEDAVNGFRKRLGLPQNGLVNASLWGNLYKTNFNQQSMQGAHFEPVAAAPETVQFLRGPGGNIIDKNPGYVRKVMPVEGFRSMGENVSTRDVWRYSEAEINRAEVAAGTIVLTSDPAEMSRFEMRAGMTLLVKNLRGSGATGVKVYVSSVEVDWPGQSVTLAVATSPLHFLELATIRQRQIDARRDPAKRARHQLRKSTQVTDSGYWEADGTSGVVPRRLVQGGQWNILQVPACEFGTLGEVRFVTDNPTQFMVIVTGQKIPEGVLNRVIGNPFTWRNVDAGRSFGDGATTADSAMVTSASANFVTGDEGRTITGPGIPKGATITERVSATQVRISPAATATATGVNLTLGNIMDDAVNTFEDHESFLRARLLVDTWGDPEQPGGFYPHRHTNDKGKTTNAPVSGVLKDEGGGLDFATVGAFLWVAVYPLADTVFSGRMKLQDGST